jgi:DivIVA domain-containing protein
LLTPEEIQSREFLVSLRGYDRDEVHAFLGRVAEQLAQTEAKATQLQQRLDRLKSQPGQAASAEPGPAAAPPAATSPEPSAMFAEIGKETQRILEAAQEAGQQIQRKARQEADRDLQSARGQAAKLIAEGERRREHIERVVSELEQSRATMSVQLRGIGRTIEQTLRELGPSDASSTVREAIGAEAARDAESGPSGNGGLPAEEAARDGDAEPEPEPSAADAQSDQAADADVTDDGDVSTESSTPAVDAPVEETPAAPAPVADGDNAPADAGLPADQPTAAAEPSEDAAAPPADGGGDAAVAAAPAPIATEPAMPPPSQAPVSAASGAEDPQGMRAAALSPLHPKLVRKVKRELQEIQNIALDKVRRAKGQGELEAFLPSDEDTAGLGEGAADLLEQAWRAGIAAGGELAGRSIETPDDIPDLAGSFLSEATERVRSGLSGSLKMGLSGNEDQQGLSDRIGSVFSDFKGAQAEELAATHLIRAYEQGLLSAWTAAGVGARTWVMGREPRCPEAKCRANDQGGAIAVGEAFPSGHDVPPVHVGCTCTTIPVTESST